ncbi:MAG: hypothetical protein REH79_02075 [Spiroplasma sp.]|nr:hypothetical protein [Spiroplasma sp.]
MNNYGRSGAILTIIGSLIMLIASIVLITGNGFLLVLALEPGAFYFLVVAAIILSIVNIVLSGLFLSGRTNLFKISGILAIVSVVFAWIAWFFPLVILLVSGILFLFNNQEHIKEENVIVGTKEETIKTTINDTAELEVQS